MTTANIVLVLSPFAVPFFAMFAGFTWDHVSTARRVR